MQALPTMKAIEISTFAPGLLLGTLDLDMTQIKWTRFGMLNVDVCVCVWGGGGGGGGGY